VTGKWSEFTEKEAYGTHVRLRLQMKNLDEQLAELNHRRNALLKILTGMEELELNEVGFVLDGRRDEVAE